MKITDLILKLSFFGTLEHECVILSLLSTYFMLFFVSLALFSSLNKHDKTHERHVEERNVASQRQSRVGLAKISQ